MASATPFPSKELRHGGLEREPPPDQSGRCGAVDANSGICGVREPARRGPRVVLACRGEARGRKPRHGWRVESRRLRVRRFFCDAARCPVPFAR
ncbi:hypothetical protein E1165_02435 [Micromonospora sp. KC723]|nr:hypothetical protein E1165_02435 [Micromonospora sp. KC723]